MTFEKYASHARRRNKWCLMPLSDVAENRSKTQSIMSHSLTQAQWGKKSIEMLIVHLCVFVCVWFSPLFIGLAYVFNDFLRLVANSFLYSYTCVMRVWYAWGERRGGPKIRNIVQIVREADFVVSERVFHSRWLCCPSGRCPLFLGMILQQSEPTIAESCRWLAADGRHSLNKIFREVVAHGRKV